MMMKKEVRTLLSLYNNQTQPTTARQRQAADRKMEERFSNILDDVVTDGSRDHSDSRLVISPRSNPKPLWNEPELS